MFDLPEPTARQAWPSSIVYNASDKVTVNVMGENFGPADTPLRVRVGEVECENVTYVGQRNTDGYVNAFSTRF